jgi:hypothetical protein
MAMVSTLGVPLSTYICTPHRAQQNLALTLSDYRLLFLYEAPLTFGLGTYCCSDEVGLCTSVHTQPNIKD